MWESDVHGTAEKLRENGRKQDAIIILQVLELEPPTCAATEDFPRSCPHISTDLGGWFIPPPPLS